MSLEDFVSELRANCAHKKLSGWIRLCWAPGHYTDKESKHCLFCGKVVKVRKAGK